MFTSGVCFGVFDGTSGAAAGLKKGEPVGELWIFECLGDKAIAQLNSTLAKGGYFCHFAHLAGADSGAEN